MTTIEIKSSIHEFIEQLEDSRILWALYAFTQKLALPNIEKDFWDELPEGVRHAINEALEEPESELVEHDQVMKKYQKWL